MTATEDRQTASRMLRSAIEELRTCVESVRDSTELPLTVKFALMYRTRLDLDDVVGTDDKPGVIRGWLRDMDAAMQDAMAEIGVESMPTDMGITPYIHKQLWTNLKQGADKEAACVALKANGYEQYVSESYNTMTLSAKARELERDGESFPQAVLEHIETTEKVSIRARRA